MQQSYESDWMQQALQLAERAARQGEVPVGALIVDEKNKLLAQGWNQPIARHDPSAHAEIMALREAGESCQNYRLIPNATLYVTLEPCAMCVGAIVHARIARLVFGAFDPKSGAVTGAHPLLDAPYFNHRVAWHGGVLAEQCATVLQSFFRDKR